MKFSCFSLFLVIVYVKGEYVGYSAEEQIRWAKQNPECGGNRQSPIEILTKQTIRTSIAPLVFKGYDKVLPISRLANNGHSVELSVDRNIITKGSQIPSISGANLKGTYAFDGLHFHWGKQNNRGSEHIIDTLKTPLELHMVHRNVKYTKEEAQKQPDGFVVLAVLYQLSKIDGRELYPIIGNLDKVIKPNSSITIRPSFSLGFFLGPIDTEVWYQYQGSLTTPPCSETVTWIIFRNTLQCSASQLNLLRDLRTQTPSGKVVRLTSNHRLPQPLNNRKVFLRTKKA